MDSETVLPTTFGYEALRRSTTFQCVEKLSMTKEVAVYQHSRMMQ